MECPKCRAKVAAHDRHCPICQHDVGFPNVRAAEAEPERRALEARYDKATKEADARGVASVVADFEAAVGRSEAVICRSLAEVQRLASSQDELYATFYQLTESGVRRPRDNTWDAGRESVDALLFPHYHKEIRFAALSLDGRGAGGTYGPYSIVLSESTIAGRATAFEENSFEFCERKHVIAGRPVPPGFRAVWSERHRLAVAKLAVQVTAAVTAADFPAILLSSPTADDSEFVEVHVYGPLSLGNIARVVGPKTVDKGDGVLARRLSRKLADAGVTLE